MPKQLSFGVEARAAMKRGIDIMTDTVGVTLGPKGRNVVLDKKFGPPQVCSDGVTIVKEIELEDPYENMGGATPEGGREQDQRCGGRRDHYRHGAFAGHHPRGLPQHRRRRQSHGHQARRGRGRRRPPERGREYGDLRLRKEPDRPRWPPFPLTTRRWASSSPR